MAKWTNKELELFTGYMISSECETKQDMYEHAHHMMYKEGNHPEFKERSLPACITKVREYLKFKTEN